MHVELERGPPLDLDRHVVEADTVAGEVPLQPVDELFRNRRGPVTDSRPFPR